MSSPIKFIDNRKFHKANYSDVMKYIIPSLYFEEDYALKENQIDILDQVINSHLITLENFNSIISISAIAGTLYSSINTPEGIAQFFVKQNNLTDIDTNDFERKILLPIEKNFQSFNSSSEFSDFLKETLIPGIRLNSPTLDFVSDSDIPAPVSANHNYLITNLSWLYFLNCSSAPTHVYNSSSFVHDLLIEKIYGGGTISLNDGMRGLSEYVWRNYNVASWSSLNVIPADFKPTEANLNSTYTSGTQQLEKLKTLMDVVYSPLYIDDGDLRVKNAIDDYLENSFLITQKYLQGPFIRLLKAFSFAFADYSNMVDRLEVLYDLDECPDEYLPMLADLIGWKLFGSQPDRWRLQLANAIDIYRAVGTKKSVQLVADAVLGQDVFDASSKITELYESYIPFLIEYALATESPLLENFSTWNPTVAQRVGVSFNPSSLQENVKNCVDRILEDTVSAFSNNFFLNGKPFPLMREDFVFNYRGADHKIPPYEEIPYYVNVQLTREMIDFIVDKLACNFDIRLEFADQVGDYIKKYTIQNTEDYSKKNNFLIFTPSAEYAPNWDSIIRDLTDTKTEYLSMWNGKSSFFQIVFDTSNFNFGKTSLEADSKEILTLVSRTVKDFSPAKAMPDILARSSAEDFMEYYPILYPYIDISKNDNSKVGAASASVLAGFGASAIAMSTYKRGLTPTSVATFSRRQADGLTDPLLRYDATTANLPRRNHRRRDLKFLLPKEGFYDRTGFNMPSPMNYYLSATHPSSLSFLPLGLIPSSMQYVPIPDYKNIPPIYNKCETLNSPSIYSGLIVSNTFPVRGWAPTYSIL